MQSNDPQAPNEAQGESPNVELEALKARIAELEAGNLELRDTVLRWWRSPRIETLPEVEDA